MFAQFRSRAALALVVATVSIGAQTRIGPYSAGSLAGEAGQALLADAQVQSSSSTATSPTPTNPAPSGPDAVAAVRG